MVDYVDSRTRKDPSVQLNLHIFIRDTLDDILHRWKYAPLDLGFFFRFVVFFFRHNFISHSRFWRINASALMAINESIYSEQSRTKRTLMIGHLESYNITRQRAIETWAGNASAAPPSFQRDLDGSVTFCDQYNLLLNHHRSSTN